MSEVRAHRTLPYIFTEEFILRHSSEVDRILKRVPALHSKSLHTKLFSPIPLREAVKKVFLMVVPLRERGEGKLVKGRPLRKKVFNFKLKEKKFRRPLSSRGGALRS